MTTFAIRSLAGPKRLQMIERLGRLEGFEPPCKAYLKDLAEAAARDPTSNDLPAGLNGHYLSPHFGAAASPAKTGYVVVSSVLGTALSGASFLLLTTRYRTSRRVGFSARCKSHKAGPISMVIPLTICLALHWHAKEIAYETLCSRLSVLAVCPRRRLRGCIGRANTNAQTETHAARADAQHGSGRRWTGLAHTLPALPVTAPLRRLAFMGAPHA